MATTKLPAIKTDKDGGFKVSKTVESPLKNPFHTPDIDIEMSATLVSPKSTTIKGTVDWNGGKTKFSGKTGVAVKLGIFTVKATNKIVVEGTTDPSQPGVDVVIELEHHKP